MQSFDFKRKLNNNKDFWFIILSVLVITNTVLFVYLIIPIPKKEDLRIESIPDKAFKTGDNSVINDPQNGQKQPLGAYMASKSGEKYYPLECPGASRITEENRIWFATKEE